MLRTKRRNTLTALVCATFAVLVFWPAALAEADPPQPPTNLSALDKPWDGGGVVFITWDASATPREQLQGYEVLAKELGETPLELADQTAQEADRATEAQTETILEGEGVAPQEAEQRARIAEEADPAVAMVDPDTWQSLGIIPPTETSYQATGLEKNRRYIFAVRAIGADKSLSAMTPPSGPVVPEAAWFNLSKLPLLIALCLISFAVLLFVVLARGGMPMKIRTIAGLKAVDEAVGRATEMGRSILYINGIQDMDDLQTVAGVTVLGRVSKTAAEYDAKIEVPTSRSLVMTAARETVQSSYFSAGRPDAYNPDLIYYVTDEQFGFVAYVSGMMTREKPAACFYMGSFFAESLILAETGNSVGAIQIAGTANPSQLPFFVAACDYTLIGEEFFAASAYLSGQPDQLGSLKGQDIGKMLAGLFIIVGVVLATIQAITGSSGLEDAVAYLKDVILGS